MHSDDFCRADGDATAPPAGLQPQHRISLTLAVTDRRALWSAAAARLLAAPGTAFDDVIALIGPCEDPSIHDCIATLAKLDSFPGCVLDDFWIDGLARTPLRPARPSAAQRAVAPAPTMRVVVPPNRYRLA